MNPALKSLVEQHNFGHFERSFISVDFLLQLTRKGFWGHNIQAAIELYKLIPDCPKINEQNIAELEGTIADGLQKLHKHPEKPQIIAEICQNSILYRFFEESHCTTNARKIIENEGWIHADKAEKKALLQDLKDIKISVILQKKIPELLNTTIWNNEKIALLQKLMSIAGVKLLELLDSIPQKTEIQKKLLRKSRILLTQQMDALQKHLTEEERRTAENNLLTECKTWLNELFFILHETKTEALIEIAELMENDFTTIWQKMEVILSGKQ